MNSDDLIDTSSLGGLPGNQAAPYHHKKRPVPKTSFVFNDQTFSYEHGPSKDGANTAYLVYSPSGELIGEGVRLAQFMAYHYASGKKKTFHVTNRRSALDFVARTELEAKK